MFSIPTTNLETLSQPSIVELAREGNFEAIACWLNTYLSPQGVSAQVAQDRPGRLLILVEFQRLPERQSLVRFICHRLYKLNSELIQFVRILARFAGTTFILWENTVRLHPARRLPSASPQTVNLRRRLIGNWTPWLRWSATLSQSSKVLGLAIAAFAVGSGIHLVAFLLEGLGSSSGSHRPSYQHPATPTSPSPMTPAIAPDPQVSPLDSFITYPTPEQPEG
jgi:hypothetical protein